MMNRFLLATLLFASGTSAAPAMQSSTAAGGSAGCIPEGECRHIEAERPELGVGDPAGATWAGGTGEPELFEDDFFSWSDDPMGAATPHGNGESACTEICNNGGELSGPNGEKQNGPGEGASIEAKICWSYVEEVQIQIGVGPVSIIRTIKAIGRKCSPKASFEPC